MVNTPIKLNRFPHEGIRHLQIRSASYRLDIIMVGLAKWYQEENLSTDDIREQMEARGLQGKPGKKEPAAAEKGFSLCVIDGMARVIMPVSPEGYEDLMAGDRIDIPQWNKIRLFDWTRRRHHDTGSEVILK
jgi:hypothetical protein